jgi:hypothetical protein
MVSGESLPTLLAVPDLQMFAEDVSRRQRHADTTVLLKPYIDAWCQSLGLCHVIVGSQSMLRALKDDPHALASELECSAFKPADWDMWVLVNSEQAAIHASMLLCKYFNDVLLDKLRINKAIRRKRVYTVVKAKDCVVPLVSADTPYPARLTGIALGTRKKTYIDVQVFNLGDAFVPSRFQKTYVTRDAPYLNLEGCVTFLELIKSKRTEKKYNIDEIRRQVINAHLDRRLGGKKAAAWYEGLAKSFERVFDGTEFAHRNKGVIGRLLLRALDHLPGGAAAVEMCEAQLIEAQRPCINATIQAIDERLSEASMGRIFVTGGDAMRRFDSGIQISKDIDTKIYVPPGHQLDDVVSLSTALVAKAVTMMMEERTRILPRNVERVISGTPVGFLYRIRDNDNLQFRLRYLPKQPSGRPRLVSVDYRMRVRVGGIEFNHNIPILDVVIQRAPKSTDPREAGTKPPIAGLPWLVSNIKHTWESSTRAKQRVWAGKRAKNMDRLQELQRRLDAGRSAREGNLGRVNRGFLEYLRDTSKAPLIHDYLALFAWAEARKEYLDPLAKQSTKQKLPFSRTKVDEWRGEMQSLTPLP